MNGSDGEGSEEDWGAEDNRAAFFALAAASATSFDTLEDTRPTEQSGT